LAFGAPRALWTPRALRTSRNSGNFDGHGGRSRFLCHLPGLVSKGPSDRSRRLGVGGGGVLVAARREGRRIGE
jgi:hypothetical protein